MCFRLNVNACVNVYTAMLIINLSLCVMLIANVCFNVFIVMINDDLCVCYVKH